YVLHDKKYTSIPKDYDPYTIEYDQAVELIKNKRIADANKLIKSFPENPDIQILNGRFGPYIKAGKKNVRIPKDREPASLTLEECIALAEAAPERRGRWGRAAAKTTEAKEPAVKTIAKKTAKKTAKKAATKTAAKKTAAKKTAAKKTTATKTAAKKAATT